MPTITINFFCSGCGRVMFNDENGILHHYEYPCGCVNDNKRFRLEVKDPQEGDYSPKELMDRVYSVKVIELEG